MATKYDPFVIATNLNLIGTWSGQEGKTFAINPDWNTSFTGDYNGYVTSMNITDNDGDGLIEDISQFPEAGNNLLEEISTANNTGDSGWLYYAEGFFNSTLTFSDGSTLTVYVATRSFDDGETFLDIPDTDLATVYNHMSTNNVELVGVTLGTYDPTNYPGYELDQFNLADTGSDEYVLLTSASPTDLASGTVFNVNGLTTGGDFVAETATGNTTDANSDGLITEGTAESTIQDSATLTGTAAGATLVEATGYAGSSITLTDGTVLTGYVAVRTYSDGTVALDFENSFLRTALYDKGQAITSITLGTKDTTDYAGFYSNQFDSALVICFGRGTAILTDRGEVAVENLKAGDQVMTKASGLQPIRWIGSSTISSHMLQAKPKLRPVLIRAGALGKNYPAKDLTVSPQHRLLVRSKIVPRMFNAEEVLVPAIKLTELDGIDQIDVSTVEYFHILLDTHEVIFANGAPAETLKAGPQALRALSPAALEEITTLFPDVLETSATVPFAAPVVQKSKAIGNLVRRHVKNSLPLYS